MSESHAESSVKGVDHAQHGSVQTGRIMCLYMYVLNRMM